MKNQIKAFCVAALALFALASCKGNQEVEAPTVKVIPYTVVDTNVFITSEYPATLEGMKDVGIYPQVTARIVERKVNSGDLVKAGDILFVLDDVAYKAAYDAALADLEMAKAKVETARLTLESKQNLYERDVISEYQLKLAKNDYLTAKAALSQAEAKLTNAENDLSYTRVRSLISGRVGSINYEIGSLVSMSITSPLTVISENDVVKAKFSIPEDAYLELMRNRSEIQKRRIADDLPPIGFIANDGHKYKFKGSLYSISGMFSQDTGALPIEATFPNPDGYLLSGGSGKVTFTFLMKNAVLVPRSSIKEVQNKQFVFKIDGDHVTQTEISAVRYNDKLWILAPNEEGVYPINIGDMVTNTTNRLKNGDLITVVSE